MATPDRPDGTVPAEGAPSALPEGFDRPPGAAPPVVLPQAGTRIADRFEVTRELGRGGFGAVVEARDTVLGRTVALKFFRSDLPVSAPDASAEADAIARLSHPNILQIFDRGSCEYGPFLVLELLEGEPLFRRMDRGPLAPADATRIALGVARGLAHAHVRGVVHRDLKPANVFLCSDGVVKVLDFGLAHLVHRVGLHAGGTPGWMAPEQHRGEAGDERTDVWALGAMLLRMLAGSDPSSARPSVPGAPDLDALLERMVASDPAKRPRDAARVVEALEPIVHHLDVPGAASAPPAPAAGAGARTPDPGASRRKLDPRLAGAIALVGALALGALYLLPGRPENVPDDGRSVAVLPFANLSPSADDAFFAEGVHSEIITQLARISGLRVIARSSVQEYREGARDLPRIGADLGVAAVLEGTVQRAGNRVRIAAQLVQAATRHQLWAESYDRDLSDTFAIQTDVALDIARTLGARLSGAERREVERSPTADREAHDLYLQAVSFWERSMGVESDNRTAEALLRKAIAKDPGFALAHAKLAQVAAEWKRDCVIAKASAERALQLVPDAPEAHAAFGSYHYYCGRDTLAGVADYEAAARNAPGDAQIRTYLGFFRIDAGQVDAGLADLERARDLDPRSYAVNVYYALALASVRRFEDSERAFRRALELQPGDTFATVLLALLPHWRDGDREAPARALEALPPVWPTMGDGARYLVELLALYPERTLALARAGRIPDPASEWPFVPRAFVVARAHAALGHADEARAGFAAARQALEAHVKEEPQEPGPRVTLARCYAGLSWTEDALRELKVAEELLRAQGLAGANLRTAIADAALAAGKKDTARDTLREALARRDGYVTPAALRADPRFAALRDDPGLAAPASAPR